MSKILLIIAPKDYQDKEYSDTKIALEESGHETITSSTSAVAKGSLGGSTVTDILLQNVEPEDYEAVAFIGGTGSYTYFNNQLALNLAKLFYKEGKTVGAICAAPMILANAGLLGGKTATCWHGEKDNLEKKGAIFSSNPVEKDGNIITANGPKASYDFGKEIGKNT